MEEFVADRLRVHIHPGRADLGSYAAEQAAQALHSAIIVHGGARMILACAPSQDEFLAALRESDIVDWSRVTLFHMDEYIGVDAANPASFRFYLQEHFLAYIRPARFHAIAGEANDSEAECRRYAALLEEAPIDVVCLGIGENGHIAFNDPPVADFNDPLLVKLVELDQPCRQQQVNDGCFPDLDSVPRHAITLTVPALMAGNKMFCMVPGVRKAGAVAAAIHEPISTRCPATIIRRHARAQLHLDADSAGCL